MQNEQRLCGVNPTALLSENLVFLNPQCRIFAEYFAVIQLIKTILRFAVPKYNLQYSRNPAILKLYSTFH